MGTSSDCVFSNTIQNLLLLTRIIMEHSGALFDMSDAERTLRVSRDTGLLRSESAMLDGSLIYNEPSKRALTMTQMRFCSVAVDIAVWQGVLS